MIDRTPRWVRLCVAVAIALVSAVAPIQADSKAEVPVETFELDNGMKFLLVPRPEKTTVAAGWGPRGFAPREPPGSPGGATFEHMMFKGSTPIGTTRHRARPGDHRGTQEALQERDPRDLRPRAA